ncbi:rhodanese-like domain-containing protein [Desulfatitalea alkaliphila]|uniref:Rhodanese-like domain-containing protein n=1 Tax=Desulfatitalea alkaliphila TaxID=2929485 RepID=A0AA41R8C0_9BACT|nr:rhodanese-like domain-containing protein [Desulfatitalea alkaliphila]MCJ8502856.1 rhodanese-like domain-containing protein [Desulfatitalea alkaliphila]
MFPTKRHRFTLFAILAALGILFFTGCAHMGPKTEAVNETELLVAFFESERDYIHEGPSFVMTAQALRTNLLTKPRAQYLIDIRSPEAFARGHIRGSVHVPFDQLYTHIKGIDAKSYENIVLICFAGQASAYGVSLLRAVGYENTVSLKWGISSWAAVFAQESWLRNISNARAGEFISDPSPPKNPPGELPRIHTGKTTPQEIIEARVARLFEEGFGPVMLGQCCLFNDFYSNGGFYVVNYWPPELYQNPGHTQCAINYPPGEKPFRSDTYLKTLSTRVPNLIYCFTGQTSAYIAGYLKILGYDARSLLFGANSMIYDKMKEAGVANTFLPEKEIMNYDYVRGN